MARGLLMPGSNKTEDSMKVSLIAAMTLCGRISPASMGSVEDRRFLEQMRAATDASLMGAGTLRQSDPEMRLAGGRLPAERLRCLVSRSGQLPIDGKKLFQSGPRPLLFTDRARHDELATRLAGRAEVIGISRLEGEQLALAEIVADLAGRGVGWLLLEGGGRLNYSAIAQGVVDELLVTLTPRLSGDFQAAGLLDGPRPLGSPFLGLTLTGCEQASSGELFLRYQINKGGECG